ncbi:hypothetical protein STRTUCAR8_08580 [Streptomyces turgidiscabies Car8]|uniref:Uncharacterized protein n=1 Tax=Streptomyces turgidiscabies (strain Car8) TaxID=698760 RepID=L7F9C4_STRT8|nr:hypothetical protein [Streptomyces turgidiscabies]ELP67631.1 hypothetical protein STRTUCAR8_08580 [Streptomyces turgidiscabies Car8]
MDDEVAFMVRGKTRAICQQYLDLVCQHLGAKPAGGITDTMPPGWIGRAVLRPVPDEEPDRA